MSENKENPPQSQIPNNTENRKNYEQKITALKEQIEDRRRKVYQLDLQGFSNNEIVDRLQVSLSTIEKDLHYMRYYCLKWSKEMLEIDYAKPLVDSSNQIEIVQKELWRLFRDEEDAIKRKKILDSIIVAAEKKVNLSKSGTILSLNASGELFQLEKKVMSDLQT